MKKSLTGILRMDAYLFVFVALNSVLALATWVSFASGSMNLGLAGFYSIGGYVAAVVSTQVLADASIFAQLFVSFALSLLISVLFSLAICRLTARLRGIFFALATLSFLEFLRVMSLNIDSLGGAVGIFGIPSIAEHESATAFWVGIWTLFSLGVCLFFRSSVLGKRSELVRLDEFAAESVGIDTASVRLQASLLSACLAAVTGVFAAHSLGTWNSRQGSFETAVALVACAVLGGMKNPLGTFFVAILLNVIPEYSRDLGDWRLVIMGAFLVAGCMFLPNGISSVPIFKQKKIQFSSRTLAVANVENSTHSSETHTTPRSEDSPILRAQNISAHFGGVCALSSVSFEVFAGEIFGVIGPNGAGKTTLMNVLSGFVPVQSGQIWLGSSEISTWPAYQRARLGLGRSFQNLRLVSQMSVLENVCVATLCAHQNGLFRAYRSVRELEKAFHYLKLFKIDHLADKQAAALSYGDRRKVEFVRALLLDPTVLVLDEPAAGLNTAEKRELALLLKEIVEMSQESRAEHGVLLAPKKLTLLVIEHDLPFIEFLCQRTLVLRNGLVVGCGVTAEILRSVEVQNAYLGKSENV